ncbi:putative reverse transcriptase domain-containing protein [Tanacetum coccineum]
MSSATSAVTYTSVYSNSEPDRAFWGADDEEISEGGIPWVIILGYDGLPMQPVAPPSPDYIPGPEDPQTLPVPQDEDEREPMFVQAHDPDFMPEPIYPEYIPLEDKHEFPTKEQPLPPVDSPTAESPRYVTESDPKENPEEYEDDETEDGSVDYLMDGEDDGDDDDGDSSGDEADSEDEDDEDEEEEEEHLATADSAIVVPVDELVFPPEGTEPVIPPPSTDITIGARITVRPQTSISLPPEAEVERLLAMTTPSPSPPISLLPPYAGERLVRSMAPPAHSSPPPVPSPLLPSSGCPTQIQTLRTESTQALIDVVTAALPSPPLPPLPPSLYIPPPVDRRDDIPESEQPPRKRLYLSTLGSRYEVGESSTARPTRGRGIDYGFVIMVDAEERRDRGLEMLGTSLLTPLAETQTCSLTRGAQDRDSMDGGARMPYASRELGLLDRINSMTSSWGGGERQTHRDHCPEAYAMTWEVLKKKIMDKYCPQGEIKKLEIELWNLKVKGNDVPAYTEHFQELALICSKFVANETEKVDKYISGLTDNIYGNVKFARPKTLDETIELANDLMDQKLRTYAEKHSDNKRNADDSSKNNHGHQQQPF